MTLALPNPRARAPATARRQALSALSFVAALAALLGASAWMLSGLFASSDALDAALGQLAQLEGRQPRGKTPAGDGAAANGSPFLEGQTITVAGAALQQRVNASVAAAGGSVLSTQIELEGPQAKDGFVTLTANVEVGQQALQTLLYDLEAGMPYLFVDTIGIQSPQASGESGTARMRVVLGVTGQWRTPP